MSKFHTEVNLIMFLQYIYHNTGLPTRQNWTQDTKVCLTDFLVMGLTANLLQILQYLISSLGRVYFIT